MIDDTTLHTFMGLFSGRSDRFGSITAEGKGISLPGPVTEQTYREHLEGKVSMGCYPLLDNGTINFFALDLDWHDTAKVGPPDFSIALRVRKAFIEELGMQVYLANSKSLLGFHVYGFFSAPVLAADIRRICLQVLNRLDMKNTEIFPKQDKIDETVKYGNYINLPYFGDSPRKFLTIEQKTMELVDALPLIKKIDPETVKTVVGKMVVQNTIKDVEKALKGSSQKVAKAGKYPPCIISILKGVGQGMRDIAAFTLASHYLTDQNMSPEDTLIHLERWNAKNTPPLDTKDLMEKIKSAGKGYDVGCRKIKDEPSLASFCVGEANCTYLQTQYKEKIKNGQIQVFSFWEDEEKIYEQIIFEGKPKFACCEKKTGLLYPVDKIDTPEGVVIMPYPIEKDGELYQSKTILPVVTMPTGVEDYGKEEILISEIMEVIREYIDIPEDDILFSVYYIMCSWVFDKLDTLSYLRFIGDVGCGKSTALDVIGKLCYKPMMAAGAVTPAPIYRIIRKYGGTLILDESDMKFTDVESDMTKILNCGVSRGRSVLRCLMDDQEKLISSPVYCPKVFSTRSSFTDKALESRCLTIQMERTDKELPIADGNGFLKRMEHIRNKLLVWRFRRMGDINGEDAINIKLPRLEPRLKQIGRPFALTFKDNLEVMGKFQNWMDQKQRSLIEEKADSDYGHIVRAIFKLAPKLGRDYITSTAIAGVLKEDYKTEYKPETVGSRLRSLKIKRAPKRHGMAVDRCIVWDIKLMKKLADTYFVWEERGDLKELLSGSAPEDQGKMLPEEEKAEEESPEEKTE